MAVNTIVLTNLWQELGTGLSVCLVQASGTSVEVTIGATKPAETTAGFAIESGEVLSIPDVTALGGGVWARTVNISGVLKYATA